MTHDDLLAKITNKLKYIRDQIGLTENVPLYLEGEMDRLHTERAALKALRAVVELHKPYGAFIDLVGLVRVECYYCHSDYPCTTIQAIEKELK